MLCSKEILSSIWNGASLTKHIPSSHHQCHTKVGPLSKIWKLVPWSSLFHNWGHSPGRGDSDKSTWKLLDFRARLWLCKMGCQVEFHRKEIGDFSGGLDDTESACSEGDLGSIPGSGRYPREGNGYSFQYSCLDNSMGRGAWWAIVHGITKSWTWLSD